MSEKAPYVLDHQVGYLMRLASQRHAAIFQAHMTHDLTPTQFAMLVRLGEVGRGSQNQLGRLTAMDVATAKGVVDRLLAKGLVTLSQDETDGRRHVIELSPEGERLLPELMRLGAEITRETMEPLTPRDRATLVRLLHRLG
ncbi:MAG: MarR family transcriptional regulator [Pseudomonadota bacterium]